MSKKIWFIHQNDQQMGPFESEQLIQLRDSNMIAQNAFVFKTGWQDWRPVSEVWVDVESHALGKPTETPKAATVETTERRQTGPRLNVSGRVIVHDNGQLIFANAVNISESGMYLASNESVFNVGDEVKMTIQVEQLNQSFNVVGNIVHFNEDEQWIKGYGVTFKDMSKVMSAKIKDLIEKKPEAI